MWTRHEHKLEVGDIVLLQLNPCVEGAVKGCGDTWVNELAVRSFGVVCKVYGNNNMFMPEYGFWFPKVKGWVGGMDTDYPDDTSYVQVLAGPFDALSGLYQCMSIEERNFIKKALKKLGKETQLDRMFWKNDNGHGYTSSDGEYETAGFGCEIKKKKKGRQ